MSSNSEWEIKSLTSNEDSYQICQVPLWVSLETIDFQINWQNTSGKRPIQSNDERQYYEDLWMNNSSIMKQLIVDNVNTHHDTNDTAKDICINEFSYLAIRNFYKGPYGIQISHYRIVKDKGCIPYAEYLLKFRTPSYEYSSWNRYSRFKKFSNDLFSSKRFFYELVHTSCSWNIMLENKSYFRNLNDYYLKKKCLLLERFLQDALFEVDTIDIFLFYFTQ
tara:strand:- start:3648 stop:4310 length:663 start_codon:yes stop_codon:yes gene_type:complete